MDYSKQQEEEGKNRQEKEKLKMILEGCVDAVISINQQGIIEFFNKAAEKLFEYKKEEVLGEKVNILMPLPFSTNHDNYIKKYLETKMPRVIGIGREVNILTKTGKNIPILLTLSQAFINNEYFFTAFIKDYSEKKEIDSRLQNLSLVASKTKNGIAITDENRKTIWVNKSFEVMSGYTLEELMGKNLGTVLQGEGSDMAIIQKMRKRLNAGKSVAEEILNYKKDGTPYWIKLHIDPIFDSEGKIEKFISIEIDISEEKKIKENILKANEKIKVLNQHYKAILDAIPDIMFRFDSKGTFIDYHAKKENEKDLITSPDQLIGKKIIDVLSFENAMLMLSFIKKALETHKNQIFEDELEMPQGKQYYECRLSPVNGKNEVLAIIRNITTHKKSQLEIINSEIRLNETQQIAKLGSWEIDLTNNQIYWSKETFNLFGIKDKKLTPSKEDFLRMVHPDDRQILIHSFRKIITEGVENTVEIRNILDNGTTIHVMARGVPVFSNGKITKVIGTLFDITERKHFEENLKTAKEKAEVSAKAKEQFLANTSHEIRTPMNAIVGVTELLKKTALNSQQLEYLDIIEKSAGNLLNIITDILDLSKIESEKLQIEKVSFLLKEIIDSVVKTNKLKADEKNIELSCNCSFEDKRVLVGDPLRLGQILQKLVHNAVKFTAKGYVHLSILLINETEKSCKIKFEVKDTGIGISEEKLASIFTKFNQADTSTTRLYGGTGLGLAISQKLVETMGGKLNVSSTPGIGTNFSFELEFEKDLNNHDYIQEVSSTLPPTRDLSGIKVLIVEDQEFNQYVVKRFLEALNATIDIAANGKLAIEKLSENDFDIILMDIQMPVMDGVEATRFIRNHMQKPKSDIPIIALTAHALKGDDKKYIEEGMNGYLAKPFKSIDIHSAILSTLYGTQPFASNQIEEKGQAQKRGQYDLSMFRNMSIDEPGFLKNIVSTFIYSNKKALEDINTEINASNYKAIKILAHTMKPSFKMIGRTDIFDMLEQVESLALEEVPMSKILLMTHKIEKEYLAIREGLEKELINNP